MFKHKKSISVITLIVFLLVTLIAAPGMALASKGPEKAPVTKGSVNKPSSLSGSVSDSGTSKAGDQITNTNETKDPRLYDLSVNKGTLVFSSGIFSYDVFVGSDVDKIRVTAKRHLGASDWMIQRINNGHYNDFANYSTMDNIETGIKDYNLQYGRNKIDVKVGEDWWGIPYIYKYYDNVYTINVYRSPLDVAVIDGPDFNPATGTYTATFGYRNYSNSNITINRGPNNGLNDSDVEVVGGNNMIPQTFQKGQGSGPNGYRTAFSVKYYHKDAPVTWLVQRTEGEDNKFKTSATANAGDNPTAFVLPPTLDLKAGGTYGQLQANVASGDIPGRVGSANVTSDIAWTVENESTNNIVSLTSPVNGDYSKCRVIPGSNWGTADVKVTFAGKSAVSNVTVWDMELKVPSDFFLTAGGSTKTLTVTQYPTDKQPWNVSWSSSNESVATVNGGIVDPLTAGTTDITASITLGQGGPTIEKTVTVTVYNPIEVQVIQGPRLNQNGIYVAKFGYKCYYPGGVTIPLSEANKFTGGGEIEGDLTTFAYSPDVFREAFTVRYYQSYGPQVWSVTYDGVLTSDIAGIGNDPVITVSPDPLDIIIGGEGTLTAAVDPGEIVPTSNRVTSLVSDITWRIIEDDGVIKLNNARGRNCKITGLKPGIATVQATFSSGYTTTSKVRVWDISLDINNLPDMPMTADGNSRNIYALIDPASINHEWVVTWKTDDENVIDIRTGSSALEAQLIPIKAGSAQVWAELNVNGAIVTTQKYEVTVVDPIELVVIGEPILKAKGVYEAKLGYKSYYPESIIADVSEIIAANSYEYKLVGLSQPLATFQPGPIESGVYHEAFTVRYYHNGPLTWTVEYDGVESSVTPGIGSNPDVDIKPDSLDLVVGGPDGILRANVDPGEIVPPEMIRSAALQSDITWTIVDGNDVISIPENARGRTCPVTPLKAGIAVVRATFANNYNSEDYTVTVWDIDLDEENLPLIPMTAQGNTRTIFAIISPDAEAVWPVTWDSDDEDENVIQIDPQTGVITPIAAGTADVWAVMTVNGQTVETEHFTVTVVDPLELVIVEAPQPINEDGTYEVTFGYVSHYPGTVEVDESDSWIDGNYELAGDNEIIKKFYSDSTGTFTVSYFHSERPLTWYVAYDGVTSRVSTGDIDEENGGELDDKDVGISVNSLDPLDAWGSPQQLKAAVKDLSKVFSQLNNSYPGINWTFQVKEGDDWIDGVGNVIGYDTDQGTTVNIQPRDPGQVKATASFNGVSDSCIITVIDPRTITLTPTSLELRRNRDPGTIVATINGIPTVPEDEESSYNWEQVYWNTTDSEVASIIADGITCLVNPDGAGYATITASLENQKSAACSVRVRRPATPDVDTGGAAPAAIQEVPAPPALETLDVTITVGNKLAIVNGAQIMLEGTPLLYGERAMVNYADMAKLIPGLQVLWDWQTQSVTFTKGEQVLALKLDQIPPDWDMPFMNIDGQLMVPARFVGSFFGVTVDWIGDTLVVHMYK